MSPCLYLPCFPKSELRRLEDRKKGALVYIDSSSGAMRVPHYRKVRRESCPLLQWSWEEEWNTLLLRCLSHPEEALNKTKDSGRTALHLATFNHPCPLRVAQALLEANRHMVLVQDSNWYTPLHNVCFFPGEALISIFCDTAIMVEQELQGQGRIPATLGTSPLFLASKRAAPLSTLRYLLATRSRTDWIAPSTGAEPYWDCKTLDEYSSPLEILLRDRAAEYFSIERIQENEGLRKRLQQISYSRLLSSSQQTPENEATTRTKKEINSESGNPEDLKTLQLWEKCIELLAEHCPLLQGDLAFPFGVLHAVACAKVPIPSLLAVCLAIFPEQALQYDERGLTPLHHILLANHRYAARTLVSILLHYSPKCVLVPIKNGPTPLSLALDRKLPTGLLQELLKVDAHATLGVVDPSTGLFPFCVAASRDYDLEVIYSLLVANPQVIGNLHS